ncbi:hypothetical protein RDV84_13650 [Lysobacter yananisis]|uniref:Uncharacterized protein n=1 Tax=Lysobacter yananisis TaxID=1003114 RepID=A0ABY9P267_9GAMM|nr:hypothetical protein [Lysobacter yananisis]WMT01053.1 hypothetical protein RDV84_13650 [Lysobacter yananisis]
MADRLGGQPRPEREGRPACALIPARPACRVYANPAVLRGLRGGAYPDAAALVYDLFETRDNAGIVEPGIVEQGSRRRIDVTAGTARASSTAAAGVTPDSPRASAAIG